MEDNKKLFDAELVSSQISDMAEALSANTRSGIGVHQSRKARRKNGERSGFKIKAVLK